MPAGKLTLLAGVGDILQSSDSNHAYLSMDRAKARQNAVPSADMPLFDGGDAGRFDDLGCTRHILAQELSEGLRGAGDVDGIAFTQLARYQLRLGGLLEVAV